MLWVGALTGFKVDAMCARWYDRTRVRAIHVTASRRLYASCSRWYLLKQEHEEIYSTSVMPLRPERLRVLDTAGALRECAGTAFLPHHLVPADRVAPWWVSFLRQENLRRCCVPESFKILSQIDVPHRNMLAEVCL